MSKPTVTLIIALLALLVAGGAFLSANAPAPTVFQNQGVSNFDSIHLSDLPEGTATPVLLVNEQSGGSANIVEIQAAGTAVWSVSSSGGVSQGSGGSSLGNLVVSAPTAIGTATPAAYINNAGVSQGLLVADGGSAVLQTFNGGGVAVAAPTAIGTAVPALRVDSSGGLSNLFEVRDSATPVWSVADGGAVTGSGGQTTNNWAKVAAATAIATATPAMVVDSLGVSELLAVRDAATPVFVVNNGGTVTGQVLRYGSSGEQIVCGTTTITGTGTLAHGLTTPSYCMTALTGDFAADTGFTSCAISGATATGKVWKVDATPTAGSVGVSVAWCVIGTP